MDKHQLGFQPEYQEETITFTEVSELLGLTLLEFGAPWCPHCQLGSELIKEAFAEDTKYSRLRHIKVFDGKGKQLGRAFKVKLWPTFILLKDGDEVARLIRPTESQSLQLFLNK
ncbi:thioredoxin family protein [Psychromonas sp. 14N.309.X.WAT.B.A12]|uniref:thioredoxin family protein n=1 Tax=unclassified Psychromonas TaxID=2614957 RepID=UPI0025B1F337|nr:thioredoxin family protein [Psychromonas sp. 14N.309.X.WAT.B.A12]MDN2663718.1 thioredoxin family protein [Psychromonas sp. 14N.309.X.WAT.B.A12]